MHLLSPCFGSRIGPFQDVTIRLIAEYADGSRSHTTPCPHVTVAVSLSCPALFPCCPWQSTA